jgi:tetratricopeptide (TPR) repeat protein
MEAERVLMNGRVDEAVQMLNAEVTENRNDGAAHLLLCRAYISVQRVDAAVPECETAVRLMPQNSRAQDWMGRAYGMKANGAGPFTGLKLAHEVREAFEASFSLDSHNADAVNDLAEYYVGAPSLVGGGTDKADDLADRVQGYMPQTAHRIHALSAEKRKDYNTAEREFSAATSVKNAPEAWVDLGGFYKRHKQTAKAVDALQHAFSADAAKNAAVVDVASYLMDMHTEPALAKKALEQYLTGDAKSDAAPVVHVHVLLGRLLQADGDKAGAKDEFNKALQLAANYGPAKKALQGL